MRRHIAAKRDGHALDAAAWDAIIEGFSAGTLEDAQMAALAMACVLRGMDRAEVVALTAAMVASGQTLHFPEGFRCVDKHSTGGVADTVSLIVVPIVAACGVPVAKLSGRALGHTGGTLDKLEAILGLRTELSQAEFTAIVLRVGCAVAAQSKDFVPADKALYALRDRTATVPSQGLIVASIVSKKIAGGAEGFVFDVKTGRGAFIGELAQARELARSLVEVSNDLGKAATALITDMEEPLGPAIGSGIETIEARDFLSGERRDPRLLEVALALGEELLATGGSSKGRAALVEALESGRAYETFCAMIAAQGGEVAALERLTVHARRIDVVADRAGVIAAVDPVALGEIARDCVQASGAFAGVRIAARTGDAVVAGAVVASVYGDADCSDAVRRAFTIAPSAPPLRPLVHEIVRSRSSNTAGVI